MFAYLKGQPALYTTKDIRASKHELRQSSRWEISEGPRIFHGHKGETSSALGNVVSVSYIHTCYVVIRIERTSGTIVL